MTRALVYHLKMDTPALPDYVSHCLKALRPRFETIVVAVSGALDATGTEALAACCDTQFKVEERADYITAYRSGLDRLGWDALAAFEEITVMSSNLFGPVFAVDEMFATMDARGDLDLWGLAQARTLTEEGEPSYLVSDMVTFRQRLLASADFKTYWSVDRRALWKRFAASQEADQAKFLEEKGYQSAAYLTTDDSRTHDPLHLEMQSAIASGRVPFLSFVPFCQSPLHLDEQPADIHQVPSLLEDRSEYPAALFWQAVLRKASLRTLHTNLAYQFTFDSKAYGVTPKWDDSLRIAVCAHVFYPDLLPEMLDRVAAIPTKFDLFITTASAGKKATIGAICETAGIAAEVRVVGDNQGRDMSALFIDLKEVVLDGSYDLICRLHSKRSPNNNAATGHYFKQFIFNGVLNSREYTSHVLDFLVSHPHVGMAFAPMIHTAYPTMGHAWCGNEEVFDRILTDLGYSVPEEAYSPLAAFGSVYWFRPDALRPMFEDRYSYDQYDAEPFPEDGGLAHGQERAMSYVAQARGYMSATIWPDYVAAQSATLMEYKMDSLYTHFPFFKIWPHAKLLRYIRLRSFSVVALRKRLLKSPEAIKGLEKRVRPKIKRGLRMVGMARSRKY